MWCKTSYSDIFKKITRLQKTDLLFFISSSYIHRFHEIEEFKNHINISPKLLRQNPYRHIHRTVLDFYKDYLTTKHEYYLAPFSIKKNANIYGIIFGSNHTLGIEKFLKVAWKIDPVLGEANYNIDNEKIDNSAPYLFKEMNIPRKIQQFEKELKDKIINRNLSTNRDVYIYGLINGFQPKTVKKVLKSLIADKVIKDNIHILSQNIHKLEMNFIELL